MAKRRAMFKRALRRSKRARIVKRHVKKGGRRRRLVGNKRRVILGQGFPKSMLITHKYRDIISVTAIAGTVAGLQFSCNGMFQPIVGGHQPMYYDQMAALYDHYTVIGSKIRWKITPVKQLTQACYVACFINDDASITPTSVGSYAEQTTGKLRQLPVTATHSVILTQSWSAKKFFPGSTLSNFALRGDTGSNPTEQSVFTLGISPTGGAPNQDFTVECDVSYIAVWTEIKDLGPS